MLSTRRLYVQKFTIFSRGLCSTAVFLRILLYIDFAFYSIRKRLKVTALYTINRWLIVFLITSLKLFSFRFRLNNLHYFYRLPKTSLFLKQIMAIWLSRTTKNVHIISKNNFWANHDSASGLKRVKNINIRYICTYTKRWNILKYGLVKYLNTFLIIKILF